MDTNVKNEQQAYIPALDGLRGLAIIMVMFFHFFAQGWEAPLLRWNECIGVLITKCLLFCRSGVDLFFVLSGFLITGILLDTKNKKGYFRRFYLRRVLRIFPLYYGTLLGVFVLIPLGFSIVKGQPITLPDNQVMYWTGLSNFVDLLPPGSEPEGFYLGHFWSLAIEMQFYLVWPAVVFLLDDKELFKISILCTPIALITRVILIALGVSFATYGFTLARIDSLAIGGLIAILVKRSVEISIESKFFKLTGAFLGSLLIAVILLPRRMFSPAFEVVGYSIPAVFYGWLLMEVCRAKFDRFAGHFFNISILKWFGKYSYGLYLFHGLLGIKFQQWFGGSKITDITHSAFLSMITYFLIAGAISACLAFASWHLYENFFLKLKRLY
jgi:peptidoglycan/LPS O-acetylase OafA/YrhL